MKSSKAYVEQVKHYKLYTCKLGSHSKQELTFTCCPFMFETVLQKFSDLKCKLFFIVVSINFNSALSIRVLTHYVLILSTRKSLKSTVETCFPKRLTCCI